MGARRFRKKPVEIEAAQWTGDNPAEIAALIGWSGDLEPDVIRPCSSAPSRSSFYLTDDAPPALVMTTVQGRDVAARPGEWIVPEAQPGRAYPIAPDVFAATYDEVTD